jgi:hypothetical protein
MAVSVPYGLAHNRQVACGLFFLTVCPFVAEKNKQHFNSARRMDRPENDPVSAGHLPVESFESLAFERLYQSPKRIVFEFSNVIENSLSAIRRNRLKLFYGFVREAYGPVHVQERPKARTVPCAFVVRPS